MRNKEGRTEVSQQTKSSGPEKLLKEVEAANMLGLTTSTLQKWRWNGQGPRFYKIGSAVRYRVSDLEAFIEAGSRASTSDPGTEHNVEVAS